MSLIRKNWKMFFYWTPCIYLENSFRDQFVHLEHWKSWIVENFIISSYDLKFSATRLFLVQITELIIGFWTRNFLKNGKWLLIMNLILSIYEYEVRYKSQILCKKQENTNWRFFCDFFFVNFGHSHFLSIFLNIEKRNALLQFLNL